jgi:hypothetical protein
MMLPEMIPMMNSSSLMMMTPTVMMSQKIVIESAASKVSFMRSMLGNRLCNVPKNCQFRSPFDSKGRRPDVPLTKALVLMKKCKKDSWLHRYDNGILQHHFLQYFVHFITTQIDTDVYMPTISVLQQLLIHFTLHCTNDYNANRYNIFVLPRSFMQPSLNPVWPYALAEG